MNTTDLEKLKKELSSLSRSEFRERVDSVLHTDEGRKLISYGHTTALTSKEQIRLKEAITKASFADLDVDPGTFVFYAMSQKATNAGL